MAGGQNTPESPFVGPGFAFAATGVVFPDGMGLLTGSSQAPARPRESSSGAHAIQGPFSLL